MIKLILMAIPFVELEEAFSLFDIDGNGLISLNELTAVMKSVGKDLVDEDIQEMLTLADKDGKLQRRNSKLDLG